MIGKRDDFPHAYSNTLLQEYFVCEPHTHKKCSPNSGVINWSNRVVCDSSAKTPASLGEVTSTCAYLRLYVCAALCLTVSLPRHIFEFVFRNLKLGECVNKDWVCVYAWLLKIDDCELKPLQECMCEWDTRYECE